MPEDKNIPQIPKPPSISNNPPQVPKPPSPPGVGVGKVPIPPKTTNIGATPVKPLSGGYHSKVVSLYLSLLHQ